MSSDKGFQDSGGIGKSIQYLLDAVWSAVISGGEPFNLDRSCFDLFEEYRASGRCVDDCVENLIDWQTAKAGGGGFLLGLPGLTFGVVTIPADLTFTTYLQLRMIATIALLHGWDVKSDRVKTLALLSLLGSGAGEVARGFGIQVGTKLTARMLDKLPGAILIQLNKAVGFRLATKAGSTGVVNFMKLVPFMGGLVSGGINAYTTRQIGFAASQLLKAGPRAESDHSGS